MTAAAALADAASPAPIANAHEGEMLICHLLDVMDALLSTIEEETKLVRAGRIPDACRLEKAKADLTRLYIADVAACKNNQSYLGKVFPEKMRDLHRRHDLFRALLQVNLTVLATAQAVSEGIVRGVNTEMQRRNLSHGYTAGGASARPNVRQCMPLSLSRSL